jgi:hypothetical protein
MYLTQEEVFEADAGCEPLLATGEKLPYYLI